MIDKSKIIAVLHTKVSQVGRNLENNFRMKYVPARKVHSCRDTQAYATCTASVRCIFAANSTLATIQSIMVNRKVLALAAHLIWLVPLLPRFAPMIKIWHRHRRCKLLYGLYRNFLQAPLFYYASSSV